MKASCIHLITVVLLGMVLAACGTREQTLPNEVVTALQTRFNENDPSGAAALFTDDGAIMSEFGETVQGKDAITTFLRGELDKRLQYWNTSESSSSSGNIGYDYGSLRIRDTAKGQDLESRKYVTVYRKVDGSWKIYRTIYNTNSLAACASVQVTPDTEAAQAP